MLGNRERHTTLLRKPQKSCGTGNGGLVGWLHTGEFGFANKKAAAVVAAAFGVERVAVWRGGYSAACGECVDEGDEVVAVDDAVGAEAVVTGAGDIGEWVDGWVADAEAVDEGGEVGAVDEAVEAQAVGSAAGDVGQRAGAGLNRQRGRVAGDAAAGVGDDAVVDTAIRGLDIHQREGCGGG